MESLQWLAQQLALPVCFVPISIPQVVVALMESLTEGGAVGAAAVKVCCTHCARHVPEAPLPWMGALQLAFCRGIMYKHFKQVPMSCRWLRSWCSSASACTAPSCAPSRPCPTGSRSWRR